MISILMTKELVDRYRTVNLPIDMVDEVDRLIDVFSGHGYTSRADFIKQAVREKIAAGLDADVTVLLRGGSYALDRPLVFGPEDLTS